jgi:hypothetical protein
VQKVSQGKPDFRELKRAVAVQMMQNYTHSQVEESLQASVGW